MAITSQNNSFTLLDLIRGIGSSRTTQDNFGFLFTDISGRTSSGQNVTVESLLTEPTTMSCINIITQSITQIPLCIRRKDDSGNYQIVEDHPIDRLLKNPNAFQGPSDFKSSIITNLLINGNVFLRVLRAGQDNEDGLNVSGKPMQLVPMDPKDVTVGANHFGVPQYHHESFGDIAGENVIHIKDIQTFTALGYSRALLAAEIIGSKFAADKLIGETFANGISMNYVISTDGSIDPESREQFQKHLNERFGQGGINRGGAMLLENGSIQSVKGATPGDADLRELRDDLKTEIAGVFRVPPFMVGGTGNDKYNNVRQRLSSFHRDTLQPIMTNIEEAITLKLLDRDNEQAYFDVSDFIKGDFENQMTVAVQAVQGGVWTPNEGRAYIGTNQSDDATANDLIRPNSSSNENTNTTISEEDPANATGGSDGPQGEENA